MLHKARNGFGSSHTSFRVKIAVTRFWTVVLRASTPTVGGVETSVRSVWLPYLSISRLLSQE